MRFNFDIKKYTRRQLTIGAAVLILAVAIVIALLVNAISPRVNTNDFRVYYDERITVPYEDTVRDGVVYINAFELSEYCRMTVTGTRERIKLFSAEDQYAYFTPGSNVAEVNGAKIAMPGVAYYHKDALWIPCEFVNSVFRGVSIVIDTELNKLSIWRETAEGSTEKRPIYRSITFDTQSSPTVTPDQVDVKAMIQAYTFITDISQYKKYLDPKGNDYLLLVNKTTLLSDSFAPKSLTTLDSSLTLYGGEKQLESGAAMALTAMMAEMRAAGFDDVYVTSAYRTYSYQAALFNTYINNEMTADPTLSYEQAKQKVLTYSAEPGTSEHQSGLCVDFITAKMTDLDQTFATYPVYRWLQENAHKFGFILRYPQSKEEVTGYSYEPWHYRFVGQTAAAEIFLAEQCLEEYLATANQ